jgi:hypothetical protein
VLKSIKGKIFLPVYLIIVQINSFRNIYKFPIETESSNEREKWFHRRLPEIKDLRLVRLSGLLSRARSTSQDIFTNNQKRAAEGPLIKVSRLALRLGNVGQITVVLASLIGELNGINLISLCLRLPNSSTSLVCLV